MPKIYQFRPSSSQRSLWLAHQLDVESSAYNLSSVWRLRGMLDRDALERALNDLVQRHEILRTGFRLGDAGLQQLVWSDWPIPLPVVESTLGSSAAELQGPALDAIQAEAQRPFDLDEHPLVRARLFRLLADEHVLVLTFHHIVIDGWSMDILRHELAQAYAANRAAQPWTPPRLPLQYADYAEWQHDWLGSDEARAGLDYWTRRLAGACTTVALPGMRAPAGTATLRHQGGNVRFAVPPVIARGMAALARRHRTTMFVIVFAALHALLHRLSRQDDVCIGYVVANRRQADTHALIGCFVNTLVLRTRHHPDQTFSALVEQVREWVLHGEACQETPFEQVVEALRPDRVNEHTPLFQVAFGFRDRSRGDTPFVLDGLATEQVALPAGPTKFDLSIDVDHGPFGVDVDIQFDQGLFARDAIERMAGHFEALLGAIASQPDTPLSRISITKPGKALPMSVTRHPVATVADRPQNVVRAFESQVQRTPQATALIAEDGVWSYERLNRRANQIAAYLRGRALTRDDIVAVLLDRKGNLVATLLGIMKAGGAYMPLDPNAPYERMHRMLTQARAKAVVSATGLGQGLCDGAVQVLCLDAASAAISACPDADLGVDIASSQVAYCLFTSGSTGQPKGVLIEHCALANVIGSMSRTLVATSKDVWMSVTSPTFDVFGLDLFVPLTVGATVVLPGRADTSDPAFLANAARAHCVNAMLATPATWRMLIDHGGFPRLRLILCGGEAMDVGLSLQLQELAETVWNGYGPTETTMLSTCSVVRGTAPPVIGQPIDNTDVMVLDAELQLLPIGVAGEIYIAGAGLARGYVGQPGLTAERFLPNPFGTPGSRMYRTGDWGYMQADGALVYLNRIDFQVKVRGFRIELGEIEAALRSCASVRDAVVVAVGDDLANRRLIAYVVARSDNVKFLRDEISQHLGSLLPAYMLPGQIQILPALPLNASGKIDRKALPPPELFVAAPSGRPPVTFWEQRIASIWAEVLSLAAVSADDNFFALGGTSMLAMRVLARLNTEFGLNAKPSLVFKHQTVVTLAQAIDDGDVHPPPVIRMTRWNAAPAKPCVYGFPAAGMYGAAYYFLAEALSPSFDLCMLEPLDSSEAGAQPSTIEALAEHYAQAIPSKVSNTPLCLLGHSFGGSVAFETARRLEQRGQRVSLVLLDATLVSPLELADDWRDGAAGPTTPAATDQALAQLLTTARALQARHRDMLSSYTPSGPFNGDALLVFAHDDVLKARFEAAIVARCRSWVRGQLRTTSTRGGHLSILESGQVGPLAALIRDHLAPMCLESKAAQARP